MRLYAIDRLVLLLAMISAALLLAHWLTRPAPVTLTDVAPASVNEIQLFQQGKLRMGLLRDRDGWLLTHPEIARAAPQRVDKLLGLLQAASLRSWPASPGSGGPGQFDQSLRSIRFDALEIDFGGPSTPAGERYVRIGNQVHLVDDIWFTLAGLPASYYREQP